MQEIQGRFNSLKQTLSCGQAFRWHIHVKENIAYGVTDKMSIISWNDNVCYVDTDQSEINWNNYFGTDDWEQLYKIVEQSNFCGRDYCLKALEYAPYLSILRQDPWEMIISYIISQNNSISNISRCIQRLSAQYGHKTQLWNNTYNDFTFPTLDSLKSASLQDLNLLSLGYRSNYLFKLFNSVKDSKLFIDALSELDTQSLINKLMTFDGIGLKVASCIALYGFHRMEVFPVDTWIKRIISDYFGGHLNSDIFQNYAGLMQQSLFLYARTHYK